MVLRGIKPRTHDLDILVSDSLLANLSNRKGAVIKRPPLRARLQGAINDTVWLNTTETDIPVSATNSLGDGYYPLSFQTHKDQVELVDGVPAYHLLMS